MLSKKYLKTKPICKVTFTFPASLEAESVNLVGDFNQWNEQATSLKRLKNGHYKVVLDLEKDRKYQYRYLVDNQEWHNDSEADEYISNPYGAENSVVAT